MSVQMVMKMDPEVILDSAVFLGRTKVIELQSVPDFNKTDTLPLTYTFSHNGHNGEDVESWTCSKKTARKSNFKKGSVQNPASSHVLILYYRYKQEHLKATVNAFDLVNNRYAP